MNDIEVLGPYFAGEIPEPVTYTFLKSDGTVEALTPGTWTGTVVFRRWNTTGTPTSRSLTILDQSVSPGKVSWSWSTGDMAAPGDYDADLSVSNGTNTLHGQRLGWLVRPTLTVSASVVGYASIGDYENFIHDSSDFGIEKDLLRASEVIDSALSRAAWSADVNGLPTDSAKVDALRRAVCAQVEWWGTTDDDLGESGSGGASGVFTGAAIGTAPAVRGLAPARGIGSDRLAPRAEEILHQAGFWNVRPLAW